MYDINYIASIASLALLVAFPCFRILIRALRKEKTWVVRSHIRHDVANGMLLPYFALIVISPVFSDAHIDAHAMALAGVYGIVMIVTDLFDGKQK